MITNAAVADFGEFNIKLHIPYYHQQNKLVVPKQTNYLFHKPCVCVLEHE